MPTYGYRCTKCKYEFEVFQKITDEPIRECTECGADVKKMIFPVGIAFKGSGFHINDYKRSDTSGKVDKVEKSEKKEPSPAAETITKAAEKVEAKK